LVTYEIQNKKNTNTNRLLVQTQISENYMETEAAIRTTYKHKK